MSLSPEQLAQRKTGITATDVAAICGLDPYRAPIDVFLDKTGRALPFLGNERTRWGNLLEAPIREDYAERHGVRVEVPGTLDHPTVTWAKATPDGVCYVPRRSMPVNGLEIKTHSFRVADWYGEPGTDQVPPHELIQVEWNMFVSGLESWDLVAFIDGQPQEYRLERDDELIGMLRESAERFLVDHVRKDVPPEPDGSASYDRYLARRYKQTSADFLSLDDKPSALAMVDELRLALDRLGSTGTEVEILKQNLKAVCGEHAGLEWADSTHKKGRARISYKIAKDGSQTNWEAAWRSLVTEAQLVLSVDTAAFDVEQLRDALMKIADENRSISLHTETVTGTRRFISPRHWAKKIDKEN